MVPCPSKGFENHGARHSCARASESAGLTLVRGGLWRKITRFQDSPKVPSNYGRSQPLAIHSLATVYLLIYQVLYIQKRVKIAWYIDSSFPPSQFILSASREYMYSTIFPSLVVTTTVQFLYLAQPCLQHCA